MGIRFYCPACAKLLHVKSFQAGKRGFCPKCNERLVVPTKSYVNPSSDRRDEHDRFPTAPLSNLVRESHQALVSDDLLPADTSDSLDEGFKPEDRRIELGTRSSTINSGSSEVTNAGALDPLEVHPVIAGQIGLWYVQFPDLGQFGPVDGATLNQWLNEGRITPMAWVWCEGWLDWQPAASVFPGVI